MALPGSPDLALADLDEDVLRTLIAAGESLTVEFKEDLPKKGISTPIAALANTLGGWVLLGVKDDGSVCGYTPPGTADLQDHLRDLLRTQVDPMPLFAAKLAELDGKNVGAIRVYQSMDAPHIARGNVYIRQQGANEVVLDRATLMELARRGERGEANARERLNGNQAPFMRSVLGVPPSGGATQAFLQFTLLASPLTVSPTFADRALTEQTVDCFVPKVEALRTAPGPRQSAVGAPRASANGFSVLKEFAQPFPGHARGAVDAGGVVGVQMGDNTDGQEDRQLLLSGVRDNYIEPLLTAALETLEYLGVAGRTLLHLHVQGLMSTKLSDLEARPQQEGWLSNLADPMFIGGELTLPATTDEVGELIARWLRQFSRSAGIPAWEPPAS